MIRKDKAYKKALSEHTEQNLFNIKLKGMK